MTCKDCGQAISMNKMCEKPIQGKRPAVAVWTEV